MTNNSCGEYSVKNPHDGQEVSPKYVEFFIKIKLRNCHCVVFYYKNTAWCTVLWMSKEKHLFSSVCVYICFQMWHSQKIWNN